MARKVQLTKAITQTEFDHGYWYTDELKHFAKELGIPNSSRLRKDELEELIKKFIRTGIVSSSNRKNIVQTGIKDYELGLKPSLGINNYTSNKITKRFIESEALKIRPNLKKRSGARYRLNRWREDQINRGNRITYADLINEYIRLNESDEPFEKIAHGRYVNFLAEYLKNEPKGTKEKAIRAWKELKRINIPKDYKSWKKLSRKS